jgi:hypothetical protein
MPAEHILRAVITSHSRSKPQKFAPANIFHPRIIGAMMCAR